jgi:hypothetical protein
LERGHRVTNRALATDGHGVAGVIRQRVQITRAGLQKVGTVKAAVGYKPLGLIQERSQIILQNIRLIRRKPRVRKFDQFNADIGRQIRQGGAPAVATEATPVVAFNPWLSAEMPFSSPRNP